MRIYAFQTFDSSFAKHTTEPAPIAGWFCFLYELILTNNNYRITNPVA
jgi:hypothetical protein